MYFNKYLKYKIKYINLLIKKGGGNENMTNISCKINKNNKLKINDNKYKNYDIFECLEKNNYLNKLEDENKKNEKIKKIFIENEENLLEKLAGNRLKENVLKKDINNLNKLVKKNNVNEKKLFDEKTKNQHLTEQLLKKKNDYENIRNKLLDVFSKININDKQKYNAMIHGLRIKIKALEKDIDEVNKEWSNYNSHIIETTSEVQDTQNIRRKELEKENQRLKQQLKQLEGSKNVKISGKKILTKKKDIYKKIILSKLEYCKKNHGCKKEIIDGFNQRLNDIELNIDLYDFFLKKDDIWYIKETYEEILNDKINNLYGGNYNYYYKYLKYKKKYINLQLL